MVVYLAVLLMCTSPTEDKVKCELIGDTTIYRSLEECKKATGKVNDRFICLPVEVKK